MKLHAVVVALVCVAGIFLILACSGTEKEVMHSYPSLPASLDQYYPPQSPEPVWFLAMLGMAQPFSASVADAVETDFENSLKDFEAFKQAYLDNSKKVPEWTERFPTEPIDRFGEAISSKDISRIMAEADSVGMVCHDCHVQNMVLAQQKYRWPNFDEIGLTDPITEQDVTWTNLMRMMESSYTAIGIDLTQGQSDQARNQFQAFNARFNAVSVACMTCHETGRYYFVSNDITDMINQIGTELDRPTIDVEKVNGLLQNVGMESCIKCHMVHVPSAYGKQLLSSHRTEKFQ